MRLFSKETLNNSWFWVSVGLLISVFATQVILEVHRYREDSLRGFEIKCPDGFIAWENSEFEITNRFEAHGDSLLEFEKRIESGCRPFDFTNVPRSTVDSLLNIHSEIHYTWIQGLMNLSEEVLVKADTTHSTKPPKYR
jgi:hypothetical protein